MAVIGSVVAVLVAAVMEVLFPLVALLDAMRGGGSSSHTSTDLSTGDFTTLGPSATVAGPAIALLIAMIAAVILVLGAVFLARGAGWARIVISVAAAVAVLGSALTVVASSAGPSAASLLVALLLVVGVVLAFLPPSSAYLRRHLVRVSPHPGGHRRGTPSV